MFSVFNLFVIFLHDSQLFIFMISSICTGLHFDFSVVISLSFNLIFETDLFCYSINYSFFRDQVICISCASGVNLRKQDLILFT